MSGENGLERIDDIGENGNEVELSPYEAEKTRLLNLKLQGEIERNEQRKFYRKYSFWFIISTCGVFYILFFIAVLKLFLYDTSVLKNIPPAWAFPLISLIALPTLLLIVLTLCAYRERGNGISEGSAKAIANLIGGIRQ